MGGIARIVPENAEEHLARILEIETLSFPTPWSVRAFHDEFRNPASRIWGWMEEDRLWGYICCWVAGPEVQILNLAVHPERRRCGLGFRLMEQAVETGTAEGAECFWLEVRTSNLAAQRLYGGFGFREIGRRPRYYRDTGEDAIVMTLSIPMAGEHESSALSAVDTRFVLMSTQRSREV